MNDARLIALPVFYTLGNFYRGEVTDMDTGNWWTCKCQPAHRNEQLAADCAENMRREIEAATDVTVGA